MCNLTLIINHNLSNLCKQSLVCLATVSGSRYDSDQLKEDNKSAVISIHVGIIVIVLCWAELLMGNIYIFDRSMMWEEKYSQYCNVRYLFSPKLDFFIRLLRALRFPLKINKHCRGTESPLTTWWQPQQIETWHSSNISMVLTWAGTLSSGQQLRWQRRVTTVPTLDIPGYSDDNRQNIAIHWPV